MNGRDAVAIMPLDASVHDRERFACGHASLDNYFRTQAGQDLRRRVAAVFVATQPSQPRTVLGYYTLAQASVLLDAIPAALRKRLPRYPHVPVTLLGRLAVAQPAQGHGIGTRLIADALRRAASVAPDVASTGIIVQPIDAVARAFYARFGFAELDGEPVRMFLPMATITKALE